MKPKLLLTLILIAFSAIILMFFNASISKEQSVNNVNSKTEESERYEDFQGWIDDELMRTRDPATGKIPEGIYDAEFEQAKRTPKRTKGLGKTNTGNTYTFAGPSNKGGRTRAIAFDTRGNHDTILAGGVSSGVFRTTNGGLSWTKVSLNTEIHNVTCIVQDPSTPNTWYYSTGEALGNSAGATGAFYTGYGVYKSTNNGVTWSRLTSSNTGAREAFDNRMDIITRLVVHPTNGNVYAAALGCIRMLISGGTTWTTVLGDSTGGFSSTYVTDIVCTTGGRFYAAISGAGPVGLDGVWTSSTGALSSWTRIAGGGTPTGWNANAAYGRVVLALAPNNQSVLFALYWNNTTSNCASTPAPEAEFFRYSALSLSVPWTDLSANLPNEVGCSNGNDPFACQGGYDLCIAVKPDDSTFVVIGGTNIYRSTNGFTSTAATTRIGGYAGAGGYSLYTNSHSDIHALVYKPGSNDTLWAGDDGGIQKGNVTSATPAWTDMANSYRTYQFYYVAIDPTTTSGNYIGGSQDNGTTYNAGSGTASHSSIWSGDGVSVGISASNTFHYVGSQNGDINRKTSGSGFQVGTNIKPSTAGSGLFITLFHLDPDNSENLYYANEDTLYRTTAASTVTTTTWTKMTGVRSSVAGANITAIATSRGPYTAGTSSLFLGTDNGKVFRLDSPATAAAAKVPANITPGTMPSAYVSWIAVNPRSDDTIMVVLSNYSTSSIWWTGNANSATPTWKEVEYNISVLSIRSCMIVTKTTGIEYYVGTHVGLYSSTDSAIGGTKIWSQEGSASGSLEYAIVSSMAYRWTDNNLLLGTHGNGMWVTAIPDPLSVLPVKLAGFGATLQGKNVSLDWKTASENNNSHFDIMRRYDFENDFVKVGVVKGHGNSFNVQPYNFTDKNINMSAKVVFYQLRQVDYNGQQDHSNIEQIDIRSEKDIFIPSLAHDQIKIGLPYLVAYPVTLRLIDMSGKQTKFTIHNDSETIDLALLAKGIYVLKLNDGNYFDVTRKIVLY